MKNGEQRRGVKKMGTAAARHPLYNMANCPRGDIITRENENGRRTTRELPAGEGERA